MDPILTEYVDHLPDRTGERSSRRPPAVTFGERPDVSVGLEAEGTPFDERGGVVSPTVRPGVCLVLYPPKLDKDDVARVP